MEDYETIQESEVEGLRKHIDRMLECLEIFIPNESEETKLRMAYMWGSKYGMKLMKDRQKKK